MSDSRRGLCAALLLVLTAAPSAYAERFVVNRGVTPNCADGDPPPSGETCAGGITAGVPYTVRAGGVDVASSPSVNASFEADEGDTVTIALDVSGEPDGCTFVSDVWVYPVDGGCRFQVLEQNNFCGPSPVVVGGIIPNFPDACTEPGLQAEILDVPASAEVGEIVTANLSLTSRFSADHAETLQGCSSRSLRAANPETDEGLFGLSNAEPLNCISGFTWSLPPEQTIEFPYTGVPQRPGTGTVAFRDSFFGFFGEFGSNVQAYPIPQPESGEIEITGGLTLKFGLPSAVSPENTNFTLTARVTNNGSTSVVIDPIVCSDFVFDLECDEDDGGIACDPNAPLDPNTPCCDPSTDPECCDPFTDACECDEFAILDVAGPASPSGAVTLAAGATTTYTCPFQTLGEKGRGFFEPNTWEWTHESGGRVELDFDCPGLEGTCDPVEDHLVVEVTDKKPPVAAFVWSIDASDPQRRIFNAASSDDEDGEIILYEWDLAGTPAQGLITSKSFGPGTHTITLTVTDDDGLMGTATEDIVIANPSPGMWRIPLNEIGEAIAAIVVPADDIESPAVSSPIFDGTEKELDLSVIEEGAAAANCGTGPAAVDRMLDELHDDAVSLEGRIFDLIQEALDDGLPPPAPGTTQTIDLGRGLQRALTRDLNSMLQGLGNVAQAGRLVRELLGSAEAEDLLTPLASPPSAETSPFQMDMSEIAAGLTAFFDADGNLNGLSGGSLTSNLCGVLGQTCGTTEFPGVQFTEIRNQMNTVRRLLGSSPNPDLQLPTTRWSERQAERMLERIVDSMSWERAMGRAARSAIRGLVRTRGRGAVPRGITSLTLSPRYVNSIQRALLGEEHFGSIASMMAKTAQLQTTAIENLR